MRCGGVLRGKIGCRHRTVLGSSVGVLEAGADNLLLGLRVKRLMGLRVGNVANALNFVGAPALLASLGRSAGLSLIAWLLEGGEGELGESVEKGRQGGQT